MAIYNQQNQPAAPEVAAPIAGFSQSAIAAGLAEAAQPLP
jgi:hypothetical protein